MRGRSSSRATAGQMLLKKAPLSRMKGDGRPLIRVSTTARIPCIVTGIAAIWPSLHGPSAQAGDAIPITMAASPTALPRYPIIRATIPMPA
ncbi:hypothetical protein P0F65_18355 [Sphingomonas sp. I4]